jgi:hypothetical protein
MKLEKNCSFTAEIVTIKRALLCVLWGEIKRAKADKVEMQRKVRTELRRICLPIATLQQGEGGKEAVIVG